MRSNQLRCSAIAGFAAYLLIGVPALSATNGLPQLWPTVSELTTLVNVELSGNAISPARAAAMLNTWTIYP